MAYTPTPNRLPASVEIPEDGKKPTGAVLGGPHERELDAIKALEERVTPSTPTLVWRYLGVPLADGVVHAGPSSASIVGAWAGNGVEPVNGYPSPGVATSGGDSGDPTERWSFVYLLDLPQGAILQEAHVYFYVDVGTVGVSVFVRARNYNNAIDPGGGFEGADIPESTSLGSDSTIETVDGGMRKVIVETTHTVDRSETGREYCVYVRGYGPAIFMPKVLCGFEFVENDQGAA